MKRVKPRPVKYRCSLRKIGGEFKVTFTPRTKYPEDGDGVARLLMAAVKEECASIPNMPHGASIRVCLDCSPAYYEWIVYQVGIDCGTRRWVANLFGYHFLHLIIDPETKMPEKFSPRRPLHLFDKSIRATVFDAMRTMLAYPFSAEIPYRY